MIIKRAFNLIYAFSVANCLLASPGVYALEPSPTASPAPLIPKPRIKNPVLRCYDLDNNGKLTADENREYLNDAESVKDLPGDSYILKVLAKWDTDQDGKLIEAEIAAAQNTVRQRLLEKCITRFDQADANDDNLLSVEEFGLTLTLAAADKTHLLSDTKLKQFFSFIDKDGNQFLTQEEFVISIIGE